MKITKILQQIKNSDFVNIFVDNEYFCSISKNKLIELKIFLGLEINKEFCELLRKLSMEEKIFLKSVKLVGRRPRSKYEMKTYLRKKNNLDELVVEKIILKLEELNLIDDVKFAFWWANSRNNSSKLHGKNKIKKELGLKGIDNSIIDEILKDNSEGSNDKVFSFLEKKCTKKIFESSFEKKQFILKSLINRGYSYSESLQYAQNFLDKNL